jgi:hypothetical protein
VTAAAPLWGTRCRRSRALDKRFYYFYASYLCFGLLISNSATPKSMMDGGSSHVVPNLQLWRHTASDSTASVQLSEVP